MRTHTTAFKNNISKFGRQLDVEVDYDYNNEIVLLDGEDLNSISLHYNGTILKSIMRQLDLETRVEIPLGAKITNVKLGIKVRNEEVEDYKDNYDYNNLGSFYVYSVEKQEDTNSYKVVCYDKMLSAMKPYEGINETFPITVNNFINGLCSQLGINFASYNDNYANKSRIIEKDMFLDGEYTYRDVLDQFAEVTASIICVNEIEELEIRYPNDTLDTIDEEYLKNINVNFGKKYGPVNSIVLSRAAESDNVYLQDTQSIEDDGLCEIKIIDNQIMNYNDRSDYLADILNKLDGLEYYINDFESTGITYYDVGDIYHISIGDETYNCLMLNDEINITQGINENIFTDMPDVSVTDYTKADKTDRKINKAFIIVDKQNGEIEALTNRVTNVETETGNMYTKEQVNTLIQNAESGVTNTFSEAGGNNILRNTNFSADDILEQGQTYEYWYGNVVRTTSNVSKNGYSILLQNNTLYQEQTIANGSYTLSFYYKKTNPLATCKVKINDKEYALTETYDTLFQTGVNNIDPIIINSSSIKISFISDINNACEIYDIMLNSGTIKLAYSQNANEVITDTVNISKGITITSSTSKVKFTANNDGIRTKTLQGQDITTFTDKGLTTKEATIENQAQIVGILRQRVGDQVWDSLV